MSEPTDNPETQAPPAQPISARAGSYYRNMRYLMCTMMIVMGLWFMYDGYVKYPKHNRKVDALLERQKSLGLSEEEINSITAELKKLGPRKDEASDVFANRAIGCALPPLGVFYLIYMLRKSRGEIRLENDILTAPAHPPIPLGSITRLDNGLWERKGIAKVDYKLADGTEGNLALDDFIYQRQPIDDIHAVITHKMKG